METNSELEILLRNDQRNIKSKVEDNTELNEVLESLIVDIVESSNRSILIKCININISHDNEYEYYLLPMLIEKLLDEDSSDESFEQKSKVSSIVTESIAESSSSDNESEDFDDSILRYNALTGFQTLLMVQFEIQSKGFIMCGIYFAYMKTMLDAALMLGKRDTALEEGWSNVKGAVYAFDFFYFFDIIGMIIYKNTSWQKTVVRHKSRHGLILFLEVVSVIPWEILYTTMLKEPRAYAYYCIRLRYILRFARVHSFFVEFKSYVGSYSHIVHLIIIVTLLSVAAATLGCISYVFECRVDNLSCNNITEGSNVIAQHIYYSVCKLYLFGIVPPIKCTIFENVLASLIPYILSMYFLSFFIIDILQTLHGKFEHLNLFTWLNSNMLSWRDKYRKEWRSYYIKYELLVNQFSDMMWAKTRGCPESQYLGKVLPGMMFKELQLDISWGPLKHSHLFRHTDIYFLRAVATLMEHKYFCPGEVIYKRRQYREAMIYIKSGIVQILSEEDGETPIFSLTSGACLGESSLSISYPSSCTVVAKDVCDLAILHKKDFLRLSKTYQDKIIKINNTIHQRYKNAKMFRRLSVDQADKHFWKERIGLQTTKWVKLTLRKILLDTMELSYIHDKYYIENLERNIFCANYLDLLVMAKDIQLVTDSVFLKDTFPFIFKPDSALLKTWNGLVLILTVMIGILFPYFVVFTSDTALFYRAFYNIVIIAWLLDLYFKSSTAIQTKHTYVINIAEIVLDNLPKPSYMIDMICVVPLDLVLMIICGSLTKPEVFVSFSIRMLKLYKVEVFFQNINPNVKTHVFLQYVKYNCYFFFIIYYTATVLYMIANSQHNAARFENLLRTFDVNETHEKIILIVTAVVCYTGSMAVYDFIFVYDWGSCVILSMFTILIYIFVLSFITNVASSHTLMQQHAHQKFEFLRNLEVTMKCFNLEKKLCARIRHYVNMQFNEYGIYFLKGTQILENFPHDLALITYDIQHRDVIMNQQFFTELSERTLAQVCQVATIHLVPAGETIQTIGELATELHILTNGVCSLTSFDGFTKKVYSGECFFVLGCSLNLPCFITVNTLTDCEIMIIKYETIKAILLRESQEYENLMLTVAQFKQTHTELSEGSNISVVSPENIDIPRQHHIKYFGYNLKKRTKKYFLYHEGFPKWSIVLKYVLLRFTFYNRGNFVLYWEISRSVFAMLTNIIFPFVVLHSEDRLYYSIMMTITILDITAFIDLYMRLHFTYFNEDGLEVSHPYHTAKQHFTHSLFIDLLACFPFLRLAKLFFNISNSFVFYLNRIIQLYRFDHLYRRMCENQLHNKGLIVMFRYLPYIIIALNILTALSFIGLCTITEEVFTCKRNTWIHEMVIKYKLTKYGAYCFVFLFTIAAGTTNSFGIIKVQTLSEMCWLSCAMIINSSLQFFFIGNTIAASLSINRDLHAYQEAMYDLVNFFGYQKIEKHVKKEIINHFEYMWHKTRGKSIHTSFLPFKSSFKIEALYNFYGKVFVRSTIFPAPNSSFFKCLLVDIKHEIYLKTGIIYSVNDVHGDIFLLLKGTVEVVGADENKLVTLRVGSVFGNLDNCPLGRRTLSIVAAGHVEVLKFSSIIFHDHLKRFPNLRRHFMKLTIFNVDFLEEKRMLSKDNKHALFEVGESSSGTTNKPQIGTKLKNLEHQKRKYKIYSRNKFIKFWENVILNILYFIDYILELYGISTQPPDLEFTILVYILDILYILKMYIKFSTSFEDEFGRIVESPKEIVKNYFKQKLGFYFDLAAVFPLEIISLFFWNHQYHRLVWMICRSNRILRIVPLLVYLENITQKLNINVLIMKSIYLFTKIILLQTTLGAIVEIMHRHDLDTESTSRLNSFSLSMMSIVNSGWKFSYDLKRLKTSVVVVSASAFIALTCKFITWYFIADSCGILYVVNYRRKNYERFLFFINRYMNNENVSAPLMDRISLYIELLWTTSRGVLFPHLLGEAPYYLKEAVLNSMFGFHLNQHPLLQHCHKDLARQMASHMKTLIFFPDDIVVYAGDIDNCMYFIHKGEVHVLSEDTLYSEKMETILYAEDMFGLEQGLYVGNGHDYTYKVVEYSIIISLCRDDWIYLLDFFPASKSVIYDRTVTLETQTL